MKKIINLLMSIILILSAMMPTILNASEVMAQDYSVKYNRSSDLSDHLQFGDFSVEGEQAFCIDHDKLTPATRNNTFKRNL